MKDIIEHLNNDGDQINIRSLPWLLTEQQSNAVKEVIQKMKFPTGFCSNIKNILTRKGDFGGVKTHDWHIFIKEIIILVYIILLYYNTACFCLLVCLVLENILMKSFHFYSMFYLYLSQTTLIIMSNRLYMILQNT